MGLRKSFWMILIGLAVASLFVIRFAPSVEEGLRSRRHRNANKAERPALIITASHVPASGSVTSPTTLTRHSPVDTRVENPRTAIKVPAPIRENPDSKVKYLRDSISRMNAIDSLSNYSDSLFQTSGRPESWSVNQENLDQIDYRSGDGSTEITKWFGDGESATAHLRAEEAQLANGEKIDRWYHPNGTVKQIERRYPDGRSISVYYYDNGSVEATRSARGEHEIFTKYDRDGRQIQRTVD